MTSTIALIAGPLVRASSWAPTAEVLRAIGYTVVVPEAIASLTDYPAWSTWSDRLIELLPIQFPLTLVGHSSACALVAQMASKINTEAIVFVDGLIPPESGEVGPAPPRLVGMLDALCGADGSLPPWSDWWANSAFRDAVGVPLLQYSLN